MLNSMRFLVPCNLCLGLFLSACSNTLSIYNEDDRIRSENQLAILNDLATLEDSELRAADNNQNSQNRGFENFAGTQNRPSVAAETVIDLRQQVDNGDSVSADLLERSQRLNASEQAFSQTQQALKQTPQVQSPPVVDTQAIVERQPNPQVSDSQASDIPQGRMIFSEEPLTDEEIDTVVERVLLGLPPEPIAQNQAEKATDTEPIIESLSAQSKQPSVEANSNIEAIQSGLNELDQQDSDEANLAIQTQDYEDASVRNNKRYDRRCGQSRALLSSYNLLTSLALDCGWRLSYIAKLNGFIANKSFSPSEMVFLPAALYDQPTAVAIRGPIQPVNLNCQSQLGQFQRFSDLSDLARQCGWSNRRIMLLNQYLADEFVAIDTVQLVLPPLIDSLRQQYSSELTDAPAQAVVSQSTAQAAIPNWCNANQVSLQEPSTLADIASRCDFDARLLARLNQLDENQLVNRPFILPATTRLIQPKKSYQYPLDSRVCQQKTYQVEYAASIGKLASTCDWQVNALLRLNNLNKDSILQLGDVLQLPPALYLREQQKAVDAEITVINQASSTDRYLDACQANFFRFRPNDDLLLMSELCDWDFDYVAAINAIDTSQSPLQIADLLVLPNALDSSIKELFSADSADQSARLVASNEISRIQSCSQLKYEKNENIDDLISLCGWNRQLSYQINNSEVLLENDAQQYFYSPNRVFERFPPLQAWQWPLKEPNLIEPIGDQIRLQSALNPEVFVAQAGIVIYQTSTTNSAPTTLAVLHDEGVVSVYQNISNPMVKPGFWVDTQQPIGEVKAGDNGLLFAVLKNGNVQSASRYFSNQVNAE